MPPRRREDDWHYGFIWGACGGAMLIALAVSPAFSWGERLGRGRPSVASAHAAPPRAPRLSVPRSPPPRPNAGSATAASESLPAQPFAANHDAGFRPLVESFPLLLPTPDTSILPASTLAEPAPLASEPLREVVPVHDLTLRGKITRLHGGWLNRKALFAAIAKVRAEGHACERASGSQQQTPLSLRFVLRASGGVESVHAVKPRDAHRPLFVCAKETLKELRFPRPRGGVAHLEAVVRLSPRSKR